ncbi:MAG: hypothetical protein QXU18_15275 [Thermoplasmatales archaeon]
MKSEGGVYDSAMKLLSSIGIKMDSIRLNRYCSVLWYMDELEETKMFVIPKKNYTLNGPKMGQQHERPCPECHVVSGIVSLE